MQLGGGDVGAGTGGIATEVEAGSSGPERRGQTPLARPMNSLVEAEAAGSRAANGRVSEGDCGAPDTLYNLASEKRPTTDLSRARVLVELTTSE